MSVVPAGVHDPPVLRVRRVGRLLEDREGVHVGAEGVDEVVLARGGVVVVGLRGFRFRRLPDRRDDPVPCPSLGPPVLHAQLLQHGRDLFVRRRKVEAQLGRLVEGPAELGKPWREGASSGQELCLSGDGRRSCCCGCCC